MGSLAVLLPSEAAGRAVGWAPPLGGIAGSALRLLSVTVQAPWLRGVRGYAQQLDGAPVLAPCQKEAAG